MSNVVFQEPGPFHLPAVQRARASVAANSAQMILYALIPGHDDPQPIHCQMTRTVARELAVQLLAAANALDTQND